MDIVLQMNLDSVSTFHIFSFVFNSTPRTTQLTLAPFSVCKNWREMLLGSDSSSFWQLLFHKRFAGFLAPKSPSKKRCTTAVSHDYRLLFLYTSAIVQVNSSWFDPQINQEQDDQYLELPQDTTKYMRDLMEALTLRLFSRKFTQFVSANCHHLLYGPAGCGKATLIESLSRMWGAHLITVQYPELIKVAARVKWSSYVDILCNYIQSFTGTNFPTIIHLHNLNQTSNSLAQLALVNLVQSVSVTNVWVIGTTTMAALPSVQLSEQLTSKLRIPFPTASEREVYIKSLLLPSPLASSSHSSSSLSSVPRFSRLPVLSTSPGSSLSSSPLSTSPSSSLVGNEEIPPVSLSSVHLLALRTHDFTYTDLKVLCDLLKEEFLLTDQKASLPFVRLMEVLSKVVPFYNKPDDARKFDGVDPSLNFYVDLMPRRRRLSVPTVI